MEKVIQDFKKVVSVTIKLTNADTTAKPLFMLPAYADILQIIWNVRTAFTGQALDIGIKSNTDAIVDGGVLAGVQQTGTSGDVVAPGYQNKNDYAIPIYGLVTGSGSAGEVSVTFMLALQQATPL